MGGLLARLEEERVPGWAAYGEALRAHIETVAARAEPRVPVVVHVDTDTSARTPSAAVFPSS